MPIADELERLAALWRKEQATARAQFAAAREGTTLGTRVARGLALPDLTVADFRPVPGGRMRVRMTPPARIDLDGLRLGPGDPVILWRQSPGEPEAVRGVMARRDAGDVWVVIDDELPELLLEGGCNLDAEAPESTFQRGWLAIGRALAAKASSPFGAMLAVLHGERPATREKHVAWEPMDPALDEAQRAAIEGALAAHEVALIHGPPGTGKTRTLVEVIRQCVARGERVLATAPSNTAVDNLALRLVEAGLPVVRIGHPARVAAALEERTLDALVMASDGAELARELGDRARDLRRRAVGKRGAEARELWAEVRGLERDARAAVADAEASIVGRAPVLCATCTGADHPALGDSTFATVVIDEATQAPDPLALIAMSRGARVVLAGDPHQLPPTVVDVEAARAGLATTYFERLAKAAGAPMLVTQHRMHADIMRFPSRSKYGGALVASPAVAGHTLEDTGARPDAERGGALWLLDTAGKDWTDRQGGLDAGEDHADPSTWNPEQAERTAREVRRLLSRGVAARDVAVIAAYDAQVRRLRALLAPERAAGLEVATVDGFQGREKEAVVVDLVRSNPDGAIGFLADTRRMNVALTRARRFLLVVGDSATLGAHPYYAALVTAIDELGAHGSAWADDGDPLA
ncbi:MAG TPA: AAA domain-containing protein [Kofleriaceae bacterium]|nr:AAA domain-containing protein [Kofleriaceae bacterium]